MDNPQDEDKVDAIVGAALKAMADSGVSRARLGAFALNFREEVAEILGLKATKPEEPDLLSLVTQAVKQAMADPALVAALPRRRPAPAKKRVWVLVNGKATSVTLSAESLSRLEETAGGRKKAKSIIQQLAESAPPDVINRSGWIQERLTAFSAAPTEGRQARH